MQFRVINDGVSYDALGLLEVSGRHYVYAAGSGTAQAQDSVTVMTTDLVRVYALEHTVVTATGSARVEAGGNVKVIADDNARVVTSGGTVSADGNCRVFAVGPAAVTVEVGFRGQVRLRIGIGAGLTDHRYNPSRIRRARAVGAAVE